jgi:glucosamine--fructose-6-phosphate aminotransferase (isomerizing)
MTSVYEMTPFLREVEEMPSALQRVVDRLTGDESDRIALWCEYARKHRRVRFVGMGTSEFAAMFVLSDLAKNGIDSTCHDAGEVLHYPAHFEGLLVAISQSGESVETRLLAERVSECTPIGAIVNNDQSTLAQKAAWYLPMHAGSESAISTKTYLNTLAVLHFMACSLTPGANLDGERELFHQLADALADSHARLKESAALHMAAALLRESDAIHFIARGPAMVSAHQAALTFMEGARVTGRAFTGGAFRHGPFEVVDESHRCVVFISGGATQSLLVSMATEMAEKGSGVVVLTDQELGLSGRRITTIKVPCFGEGLFPLSTAVAQSLLLEAVARSRGYCAGDFRHSQKITTRE